MVSTYYKVGFTGTQDGMTKQQLISFFSWWLDFKDAHGEELEFHQGQCIGADHQATLIVKSQDGYVVSHPPLNKSKVHYEDCPEEWPEKDYLARNRDIVDVSDVLIAAPKSMTEETRSGTWATVRYARNVGKPIIKLWPSGGFSSEGIL